MGLRSGARSMTTDQWQKVEALYRAAYDADPRQRAELLAHAEPDVRREVERLLEQRSHGLLDEVAMDLVNRVGGEDAPTALDTPVMRLAPGTALGPYTVVATLGVGGMGEVYSANDTKLERLVALKVLPRRFSSDPDRLARMKREARVLASLNHPNIASIYGLEESDEVQALGTRAGRRTDSCRSPAEGTGPTRRGASHCTANRRCARRGARTWHRSSRFEAGEHQAAP